MSVNKIEKQLLKPRPDRNGPLRYVPAILADSKAKHIKKHRSTGIDIDIKWWYKGGSTIQKSLDWLKRNLSYKVRKHVNISLYVWLGTCDLTQLDGKYTKLRADDNSTVDYLEQKYNELLAFVQQYPTVKVTILEVPVYSIVEWNKSKGHKDPQTFSEQDNKLQLQVQELNNRIRNINNNLSVRSPRFSLDLLRSRKNNKGRNTKSYFNFQLYADGIHPDLLLSKPWFRQITSLIIKDCHVV